MLVSSKNRFTIGSFFLRIFEKVVAHYEYDTVKMTRVYKRKGTVMTSTFGV